MNSTAQPTEAATAAAEALQDSLRTSVEGYLQCKQAHWVVSGPLFEPLHALFETCANTLSAHADTLAERIVQLGGRPRAGVVGRDVPGDRGLQDVLPAVVDTLQTANTAYARAGARLRELRDEVTANLLLTLQEGVEKLVWRLNKHRETPEKTSASRGLRRTPLD